MNAFGPLSTLFRAADRPAAPDTEVDWYASRIPPDALALDVMCGYGRLLTPLVARGRKVHGVDSSAAMLARCGDKLAAGGAAAPTFRQDVAQMNLPFRYGCAFVAGEAFQLLAQPWLAAAALERIRAHLVDPGLLFVDCRVPPLAVQRLGAPLVEVRTVRLADGAQIALRSETTWSAEARLARAANRYAHRRGAQRLAEEHERIAWTWYPADECRDLLLAAGYRHVDIGPPAGTADEGDAYSLIARA
ncbi:MAG: class I SAM-dependent methyltransferase [Betaproteobacteria bacterium]|nr:class I SAM-dependent methyltransferase [Betaproteobacteria bacterium]